MLPDNYEAPFSYTPTSRPAHRPPRFFRPPMFAPPPPHGYGPGMSPHFYQLPPPPPPHLAAPCNCGAESRQRAPAPPPCQHQQHAHNPFMPRSFTAPPPSGCAMHSYAPPFSAYGHAAGHCGYAPHQPHARPPFQPPAFRPQPVAGPSPSTPGSSTPHTTPPAAVVDARYIQKSSSEQT